MLPSTPVVLFGLTLVQRLCTAAVLGFGFRLALNRMGKSCVCATLYRGCVGKERFRDRFLEGLRRDRDPCVALSIVSTAAAVGEVSGFALWLVFYLVYGAAAAWLVATLAIVVRHARRGGEGASRILTVLAWTAIPSVVLSFVSTAGAAVGVSGSAFWPGFYVVWYGAAGVWLVATTAMVVRYTRGPRGSASGILKPFAWTAIPIVTLSIVSTAGAAYGVSGVKFWLGFYFFWPVAAGGLLVTTIAIAVLYVRGRREIASRVLAGVGVGALAVGTTGLANFATIVATFQ